MRNWLFCLAVTALAVTCFAVPAAAQTDDAVESGAYELPERAERFLRALEVPASLGAPSLSPNGRYLAFIMRTEDGAGPLRIVITDLDAEGGPRSRSALWNSPYPTWLRWASDDRILAEVAPRSFNYSRLLANISSIDSNLETEPITLTQIERRRRFCPVTPDVVDFMLDDADHVLISACDRVGRLHLWRTNVRTGEREIIERGSRRTRTWYASNGVAFMRVDISDNGGRMNIRSRPSPDARWRRTFSIRRREFEEQQESVDFEWAGQTDIPGQIYVRALQEGENFIGIHRYDLETGAFIETVAQRDDYDIDLPLIDPHTGAYYGYRYIADRPLYHFESADFRAHYQALAEFFGDQIDLNPVSFGGDRMVLDASGPTELGTYYVYDFEMAQVEPLYATLPQALELQTFPVETLRYTARDGLEIEAFMTWPAGSASQQVPLIVMPHGGPEARDYVVFDEVAQFLATLGYAVLQPNFRGSDGYGSQFVAAGRRQWGHGMQTDLIDGVDRLAEGGRIDPERVCIVGFSYGGYAALAGIALHPERYRCAVSGGGVSDLAGLIEFKSALYGDSARDYWIELLGDPDNEVERARMDAISPVNLVDRMAAPVLLMHGNEDDVVNVEQSRLMAQALERAGRDHVYIEEAGGAHSWGRSPAAHSLAMRNVAAFLDDAMDGSLDSYEPIIPIKPEREPEAGDQTDAAGQKEDY